MRTYKRLSDNLRHQASRAIQGEIISNDKTESKVNLGDSADEFEPPKIEICTPGKHKLQAKDEVEKSGLYDLISSMSEKCKFKKIHINVEFVDSN